MKILVFGTKSYDKISFEKELKDYPDLQVNFTETNLTPLTATLAQGYKAVCGFVNSDISAMTLEVLRGLGVELVLMRCAGFDAVNVDFAKSVGMRVTRVPAYSPHAVAEYAVALMLSLNRKIQRASWRTRDGNFSLNGLMGFDMYGKTLGVIGTGKIAKVLIGILRGFGMKVLAYDLYPDHAFAEANQVSYVSLDELYAGSDIISLHCPLTPETEYIINRESIAKMKKGVMIINTGRGRLIHSEDLIEGLKNKQVGFAGLDVYEEEEPYFYKDKSDKVIDDDTLARLLSFNNVILTSHQAFFTEEATTNIALTTFNNIEDLLAGRPVAGEVKE